MSACFSGCPILTLILSAKLCILTYFSCLVVKPSSVPHFGGLILLLATENFLRNTFWQMPLFPFISTFFFSFPLLSALSHGAYLKFGSLHRSEIEKVFIWHKGSFLFSVFAYLIVAGGSSSQVSLDRTSDMYLSSYSAVQIQQETLMFKAFNE